MNGLNGAHLVHGENNIPNGGSSVTSQADFIKTSLEWITKEIGKFKQEDVNLRLKFHNLNKMVGELRHELDTRHLAYMDSDSSLVDTSRSSLEPTTIHQYTESPRLSRRGRTSPSPQPSPVKGMPTVAESQKTPPSPARISRSSPLTKRPNSVGHSPPSPLVAGNKPSSPMLRVESTPEAKGSPPILPRPFSFSPGKSPRKSPVDPPTEAAMPSTTGAGSGSPSLPTARTVAVTPPSPATVPKNTTSSPKTTPKHSPFLPKRAPKNQSPSPIRPVIGKPQLLPMATQTTPTTKPVTPQKYSGSNPQNAKAPTSTAVGRVSSISRENLPPQSKQPPPVVKPKPALSKPTTDKPATTPTSAQGGVSQVGSQENGRASSPPLDHSSIDLSLDMSGLGGDGFADDLFAALKTKGFGSLDL